MKILLAMILLVAIAGALEVEECHVDCPKGSHGGCVKVDQECYCSCRENADDAKKDILQTLRHLKASPEFQEQVRSFLSDHNELRETTLTDPVSKKQFTLSLKTIR